MVLHAPCKKTDGAAALTMAGRNSNCGSGSDDDDDVGPECDCLLLIVGRIASRNDCVATAGDKICSMGRGDGTFSHYL